MLFKWKIESSEVAETFFYDLGRLENYFVPVINLSRPFHKSNGYYKPQAVKLGPFYNHPQ